MHFAVFDSTGNLVESFDDEAIARGALEAIVREEPDAAEHLALISFDGDGIPVGEAITVADSGTLA